MTVLITFVESALSHRIVRFIVALYVFLMSCKNPIKPLAVICLFLSRSILVNILLSVNPPANMEAHLSQMQLCRRIRLLSFECGRFRVVSMVWWEGGSEDLLLATVQYANNGALHLVCWSRKR